jgi:LmbE family N-acetylglucosaminyl deacetylase
LHSLILFVSPHLDDIALSCGGFVHRLALQGERVVVATVCTADKSIGEPLSKAAQHEHWQWQLGEQPYLHRRAEDTIACATLDAQPVHLGLLDAIYRHDDLGEPLYTNDFMSGAVHAHDWHIQFRNIKAALRNLVDDASQVYSPLAIGGHVDHVIVRRAVEELIGGGGQTRLRYYEDFPYAAKIGEFEHFPTVERLTPRLYTLTEDEIETRIRAIACYPSQLFAVFGSAQAMPEGVRNYVEKVGGERYWTHSCNASDADTSDRF